MPVLHRSHDKPDILEYLILCYSKNIEKARTFSPLENVPNLFFLLRAALCAGRLLPYWVSPLRFDRVGEILLPPQKNMPLQPQRHVFLIF